jgi:hypothetical protein
MIKTVQSGGIMKSWREVTRAAVALLLVQAICLIPTPVSGFSLCPRPSSRFAFRERGIIQLSMSSDSPTKSKSSGAELPELKGDFDWDEKFQKDPDWIVTNVPGKMVLNEIELAKQVTALTKLENKWRNERELLEYEESRKTGFVASAETMNGRFAMFFLVTGLLTEYWTGYSLPQQVEEMLRIGGFIGFD